MKDERHGQDSGRGENILFKEIPLPDWAHRFWRNYLSLPLRILGIVISLLFGLFVVGVFVWNAAPSILAGLVGLVLWARDVLADLLQGPVQLYLIMILIELIWIGIRLGTPQDELKEIREELKWFKNDSFAGHLLGELQWSHGGSFASEIVDQLGKLETSLSQIDLSLQQVNDSLMEISSQVQSIQTNTS